MCSLFCHDLEALLCGGRHQVYRAELEDFLQRLGEVADLVFFKDDLVVEEKFETIIQRRNSSYEKSIVIIDKINDQVPLTEIAENRLDVPLIPTLKTMAEALTRKTLIVAMTKDCDAELAQYAKKHEKKTLFVLSDDMDFLIFKGKYRFCSLKHLDLETTMTLEYDRLKLRNHLKLDDGQLTIMSTLAGNDIVNFTEVAAFYFAKIRDKVGREKVKDLTKLEKIRLKFEVLADYIRNKLSAESFHQKVNIIARDVLRDTRQETKTRIKSSLNQYSIVSFTTAINLRLF